LGLAVSTEFLSSVLLVIPVMLCQRQIKVWLARAFALEND
jgi:hypothetical protein